MLTQPTPVQQYKIQLVRGIAILAVVLIHSLPDGLIQVFVRPFINFAVPCFLFLSGMLSNAKRWPLSEYSSATERDKDLLLVK